MARLGLALLLLGGLAELVVLWRLDAVYREQTAMDAKWNRQLEWKRRGLRDGAKLEERDNEFWIVAKPRRIRPGVTAIESYNSPQLTRHKAEYDRRSGELKTDWLLLKPLAVILAVPTVAGAMLAMLLRKALKPSGSGQ